MSEKPFSTIRYLNRALRDIYRKNPEFQNAPYKKKWKAYFEALERTTKEVFKGVRK